MPAIRPTKSDDTEDSAVAALGALGPALGRMDDDAADDMPVSMSSTSLLAGTMPAGPGDDELPESMSGTSLLTGSIPNDADDDMPVSMSSTSLLAGTMPAIPDSPDDKNLSVFGQEGGKSTAAAMGLGAAVAAKNKEAGIDPKKVKKEKKKAKKGAKEGKKAAAAAAATAAAGSRILRQGSQEKVSVFGDDKAKSTAASQGLGAAVAAKNKEAGIDPKKVQEEKKQADTEKKAAAAGAATAAAAGTVLKADDDSRMSVFDSIRAGAAGAAAALGLGAAVAAKNEQDAAAAAAAAAATNDEAKVAEGDADSSEQKKKKVPPFFAAPPTGEKVPPPPFFAKADETSVVMGTNPVRGAPETPKSIKAVPLSEEAKREQRAKLCRYGAFGALLLIVLAVGLGLGLSRKDDGGGMAPTAAPTSSPTLPAFSILLSYLASISPDGGAALEDTSSPQYQAAEWLFTNPGLSDYTETEINQRYALATIYLATDGDNWRLNDDWLDPEAPECLWLGIGCEARPASGRKLGEDESITAASLRGKNIKAEKKERRTQALNLVFVVTKVDLFELELSGPLPSEIAILTGAKDIRCYSNSITGPIPDAIGDIEGLEILELDGNLMTGTLPSSMFGLTALTKLRLETNEFTGTIPATVSQLSNLVDFRVENNMLTGEINPDICANDLERLSSDCGGDPPEIECSCCTQCFDGTEAPDGRQA